MSDFIETAEAVEPVIKMLNDNGCRFARATIYEDGSGSIVVGRRYQENAARLLREHGVDLGHGYADTYTCSFDIRRGALKKYSETLCPHCGKDTEAVL